MAERKAVNKYYPPDWTPQQGSINNYVGQHPLRERARKLSQGILVIRFEMPYNIWCGGCGNHIGMGVRYNAEKKKVGNYYTTPIYRFRMKCHLCDNYFEIDTDPKNCDYVIVSGARRKEERWEPSATENVQAADKEESKKLSEDAMYKLEHGVEDRNKSKSVAPVLEQLKGLKSVWKDDYSANQLLRKKFREEKKEFKAMEATDKALKQRGALDLPLLPEAVEDIELARKIRYHSKGYEEHRKKRRHEIASKPFFKVRQDGLGQDNELKRNLLEKRRKMKICKRSASLSKIDSDLSKYGVLARQRKKSDAESDNLASNAGSKSSKDVSSSIQPSASCDTRESLAVGTNNNSEPDSVAGFDDISSMGEAIIGESVLNRTSISFNESENVILNSSVIRLSSSRSQDKVTSEVKQDLSSQKFTHQSADQRNTICSRCCSGLSANRDELLPGDVIGTPGKLATNDRNGSESLTSRNYSLVSCDYDDSSDASL